MCDVCLQEDDDGDGSAMGGEFATQVGRVFKTSGTGELICEILQGYNCKWLPNH